jgi:hypothetical protein
MTFVDTNNGWEDTLTFCDSCTQKYPESLIKAHGDTFDYKLRLRSGETISFTNARICGDYAHLSGIDKERSIGLEHVFDRGIEVRVSDIVWCADAPDGS